MASDVDICNMALAHIGSDTIVASITPPDGSVEAGHCARFYPIARTECMDWGSWAFALKRVALSAVANPSQAWGYAYALPSDMLSAKRVIQTGVLTGFGFSPSLNGFLTPDETAVFSERGSADFTIEGDTLLTNEPEAVLLYTRDITDTSKFTPQFIVALSYLLASFLAGPIIKGSEGAKTAGTLRSIARKLGDEAAASDANASSEPAADLPQSIRARM